MRHLILAIPISSIFIFIALKSKPRVLINGSLMIDSMMLILSFLLIVLILSISTYTLYESNLFIIRNHKLVTTASLLSFIGFAILVYLLNYLPSSIFYEPRRYLAFDGEHHKSGIKVLFPFQFGCFLAIYYMLFLTTILFIILSPNINKPEL